MILFLYGEDTYRSRQKLEEIRAKFLRELDPAGLNLTVIDGEKADVDAVRAAVFSVPFLAKKRLVILKKSLSSAKKKEVLKKELEEVFSSVPEDTILVLHEESGADELAKGRLFERFKGHKFYPEFVPLQPKALTSWIQDEAKRRGATFTSGALTLYSAISGNDLWKVSSELDKLASYAVASGRPIDRSMIDAMVDARIEVSLFELMDALGARKADRASAILEELLKQGESEVAVINRLQGHFRTLLMCSDMARQGAVTKERLARELGLHPFVASKAVSQARYFGTDELARMYAWLIDADERLKQGGWCRPRMAIDLFMLQSAQSK